MTERINITLPPELLALIDETAARQHLTRSGFLRAAALDRLAADGSADDRFDVSGGTMVVREDALAYASPPAVVRTFRAGARRPWPPSPEEAAALLTAFFAARTDVEVAYLFGSVAPGEAHAGSDLDVAILLVDGAAGDEEWNSHAEILARIASLFGTDKIDLVILNSAPASLALAIVETGVLVAGADRPLRIRYEAGVLARAGEVAAADEARRAGLLDRILNGRRFDE